MSNARKVARKLVRTRDFEAFDLGPGLDLSSSPGLIMTNLEILSSENSNYHCYTLAEAVADATTPKERWEVMKGWLRWAMQDESRFLFAVCNRANVALLDRDPVLARTYVEAAIHYWPALEALGPRFGPTVEQTGRSLLASWEPLYYSLGVLGLSTEEMRANKGRTPQELLKIADEKAQAK